MSSVPSSTTIPSAIARGGDTSVGDVVPADTANATVGAALESNALPGATPSLDPSVQGRFEGQLAANATLQRVAVTCGECSTLNSVEVPRRTYHVVTLGVGGVGIFESQAIADAFVSGHSNTSRTKANSKEEALLSLKTALAAGRVIIRDSIL